jgi:hypothetical protein
MIKKRIKSIDSEKNFLSFIGKQNKKAKTDNIALTKTTSLECKISLRAIRIKRNPVK